MARTLAGMTPVERKECVGRWADIGGELMVIHGMGAGLASWVDPRHFSRRGRAKFQEVAPRFDLPRAWNPDGTPPDGCWEYSSAELPLPDYSGKYTQHYRRHVTEWEATDE